MAKSKMTKKYTTLSAIFFWLSLIVTLLPVLIGVIVGFVQGDIHSRMILSITVVVAFLLFIVNVIFKYHIRSVLWILILGIYFCLDNMMPLLLVVAIGTIVDEFILTPLHKSFKNKKQINIEIDKRGV